MGRKYTDNALTTLASSITALSTTLNVTTAAGNNFPAVSGHGTPGFTPDYFVITMENAALQREKIRVENRAAGSDTLGSVGFPLVRGYDGTTAMAWSAGDSVDLRVEHSVVQDVEDKKEASVRSFGNKGATTAGLTFGYYGGTFWCNGVISTIADGTIALIASATNFVEMSTVGVVSANTSGFTASKIPLYQVTTDSGGITVISDKRSPMLADKTGGLAVAAISVSGPVSVSGAAGTGRAVNLQTVGVNRWIIQAAAVAEAGGNAGSDFQLIAADDSGTFIDTPFQISRAAGGTIAFGSARPITGGRFTSSSSIGIGGTTPSGGGIGIAFPSTPSPSTDPNTLDDYEEGTWTPSVGGTTTYLQRSGTYVKAGAIAYVSGRVSITSTTSPNQNQITGGPFQNHGSESSPLSIGLTSALATALVSIQANIGSGSVGVFDFGSRTAASVATASNALFTTNTVLEFGGTFRAVS